MFRTQPGSGSECVISPVGTRLQLNCSVVKGYSIHQWSVHLPGTPRAVDTNDRLLEFLMEHGITVQNLGTQTSEFIFSGRENNSQTIVRCIAVDDNNPSITFPSEPVEVIIYSEYKLVAMRSIKI